MALPLAALVAATSTAVRPSAATSSTVVGISTLAPGFTVATASTVAAPFIVPFIVATPSMTVIAGVGTDGIIAFMATPITTTAITVTTTATADVAGYIGMPSQRAVLIGGTAIMTVSATKA